MDLFVSPNELMRGLESVKPNRLNLLPLRGEFGCVCSRMTTSVRMSTGPAVCAPGEWAASAFGERLCFTVGDNGRDGDLVAGLELEEGAAVV